MTWKPEEVRLLKYATDFPVIKVWHLNEREIYKKKNIK